MNSLRILRRVATLAPYLLVPAVATGVIVASEVYNPRRRRHIPPILSWQDAINNLDADHRIEDSLRYLESTILSANDSKYGHLLLCFAVKN